MIRLDNVTKEYPEQVLFKNVSLAIKPGMRIGLVGPNGVGKTTVLRLLLGEVTPDRGTLQKDKAISIGYLPQDIIASSQYSILEEVLQVFPEVARIEVMINEISGQLATRTDDERLMNKLGQLQQEFEGLDGWHLEYRAKKILSGLGFQLNQLGTPMTEFSGGWRMRVALAGILLQNPDYLLLDEPSNHLDLEATLWLEDFLNRWKGCLVIISHDRAFLDRAVNHIIEIEKGVVTIFTGNYSQYRNQKKQRQEHQWADYRNQQKKIATTERFIERFRYKNTKARQVQSRIKQLQKMKRIEAPEVYQNRMKVQIPQPSRSPLRVCTLTNVAKQYGNVCVYKDLNLNIERGQRIGLVGPNGAGKSTLLKILAGAEPISGGQCEYGQDIVRAYFAQHQLEMLDAKQTVFETIQDAVPAWSISQIKGYLGSFLFSGDKVEKLVFVLSGGEKSRLALAKMLVQPAHLLLLDEPTNHLDMISRDVVEQALTAFQGTILCISHDRHFLNKVTNLTYEIVQGRVTIFHGNYDYYEWKKQQSVDREPEEEWVDTMEPGKTKIQSKGLDYKQRKRIKNRLQRVNNNLTEIEVQLTQTRQELSDPAIASDYTALQDGIDRERVLEERYHSLLNELEQLENTLSE